MVAMADLRARCWLVGGSFVVGGVATPIVMVLLLFAVDMPPVTAAETTFALGGIWFGFGLLGWAGSVGSGRAVEAAQRYLDIGTEWTERRSRRAMARIGGFGAGLMSGATLLGTVVG